MGLPLPNGTLIQNRYRILRVLGQGGFGRTYLAQDTNRFDEHCVLKEFDPQSQGSKHAAKAEELFAREAGVLYRLQHPQIPQFRELLRVNARDRDLVFLVQDYVAGKTYEELLDDRRKQGLTFSEAEALQILQQLLPVLDYIHRSGIVHRDISPDNIIQRDSDQKPVLIDFGVVKAAATQLAQQSSSQTFVGKPGYAPIEQIKKGKADPSSDLYALAVTIAVLLTGREAQSLFDPMTLACQWKQYTTVSPTLAQVIDQMLSSKPSDRYASAREVIQALSRVVPVQHSAVIPRSYVAPPSQQGTIALAGRHPRSRVVTTGTHPRSLIEVAFDVPMALINGVFHLLKGVFKLIFGIAKFTVFGTLKLVFRLLLWVVAIVGLIWLVPQIMPYVASSVPGISKPAQGAKQATAQTQDYEAECRKLGLDYSEFINQVNTEFYRQYPDRRGKPLSNSQADKALRDEWHRIAQTILTQRANERKQQKKVAEY